MGRGKKKDITIRRNPWLPPKGRKDVNPLVSRSVHYLVPWKNDNELATKVDSTRIDRMDDILERNLEHGYGDEYVEAVARDIAYQRLTKTEGVEFFQDLTGSLDTEDLRFCRIGHVGETITIGKYEMDYVVKYDGKWHIVDIKTGRMTERNNDGDLKRYREKFQSKMKALANIIYEDQIGILQFIPFQDNGKKDRNRLKSMFPEIAYVNLRYIARSIKHQAYLHHSS